jgi:hypothetical protein
VVLEFAVGTVHYFSRSTADKDDLCQFLLLYASCILFVMLYASFSYDRPLQSVRDIETVQIYNTQLLEVHV